VESILGQKEICIGTFKDDSIQSGTLYGNGNKPIQYLNGKVIE